jgi:hypothetical protein
MLTLAPASQDSFPALPLLVSYECTQNNPHGYHPASVHHHRWIKKRAHLCVFLSTLADKLFSCSTPCARPITRNSQFGTCWHACVHHSRMGMYYKKW